MSELAGPDDFPTIFDQTDDEPLYRNDVRQEELESVALPDPFAEKPELRLKDVMNLPGALSIARLPLGIATARAIHNEQYVRATAYGAVAGITDGLDGWLARRRGKASGAGALADIAFDRTYELLVIPAMREKGLVYKNLGAAVIASEAATVLAGGTILAKTGDVREIMPKKRGKTGAFLTFVGGTVAMAGGIAPEQYKTPTKLLSTAIMGAGFGYGIRGRWEIYQEKKTAAEQAKRTNVSKSVTPSFQR